MNRIRINEFTQLTGRSSIRGKLIGRKKMRDSDLIRKLLKSGVSYRQISLIASCSHGSVSAERAAIKKEEAALKAKLAAQAEAERELQELGSEFPDVTKAEIAEPTPS